MTSILNGQRAATGDTALRLAHFFGGRAEFWMNLQKLYELRLAEEKSAGMNQGPTDTCQVDEDGFSNGRRA